MIGWIWILLAALTGGPGSDPGQLPEISDVLWPCVCAGVEGGAEDEAIAEARRLVDRGNFKAAQDELGTVIRKVPQSADAGFLLGYVLLRLDRPKESLAEYTRAAGLRPPSAEDLRHVADDYVLLNDFDDADKWMLRAVQLDSGDAESWYGLGRIRYSEQKFKDAADCFQKTLALAPKSVKAADNLGLAYEALNRTPEAMAAFERALEFQKNSSAPSEQPMLNLATVYVDQGELEKAEVLLVKAAEIAPKDAKIHEQLGQVYLQKGRLSEAQGQLESALALAPESAAYHFLLGRVYQREGLAEKSKEEFERARVLNGTHSTPSGP